MDSDRERGERSVAARPRSGRALPWVACGVVGVSGTLLETFLDAYVFADRTFFSALLRPGTHEAWMRGVAAVSLLAVALLWSRMLRERDARADAAEQYSERLGELVADVARDEASERRRVAESLHEDVGQHLVAARMFLESVIGNDMSDEMAGSLRSVSTIVDRAVSSCRDLAEDLSPRSLDEYGLEVALANLARAVSRRTGARVVFRGPDSGITLRRDANLVAFGVVAALLGGALLDEETRTVDVSAASVGDDYVVSIEWAGTLDWDLFAAEERLRTVGGRLEQTEQDGRVSVAVILPVVA